MLNKIVEFTYDDVLFEAEYIPWGSTITVYYNSKQVTTYTYPLPILMDDVMDLLKESISNDKTIQQFIKDIGK